MANAAEEASAEPPTELAKLLPNLRPILTVFRIPAQDVEDLIHDVLLIFLTKRDGVRRVGPWLTAVMRHRCRQYWDTRRRKAEEPLDTQALAKRVDRNLPAPRDERLDAQAAVRRLSYRDQSVIVLRYREGFTQREVAAKTGLAASSIDKTGRRILAGLRRQLNQAPSARR